MRLEVGLKTLRAELAPEPGLPKTTERIEQVYGDQVGWPQWEFVLGLPGVIRWWSSAHCPERGADLVDEDLGLFERREVAALEGLVPVVNVREAALRPATGWPADLLRED